METYTNKFFMYEGKTLIAAQPNFNTIKKYYKEGRKLYHGIPQDHKIDLTRVLIKFLNWKTKNLINESTIKSI